MRLTDNSNNTHTMDFSAIMLYTIENTYVSFTQQYRESPQKGRQN